MDDLLERLAALEHEQWSYWAKGVAGEVQPDRRKRWRELWKMPYSKLPGIYKEEDRMHARRVLALLADAGVLATVEG